MTTVISTKKAIAALFLSAGLVSTAGAAQSINTIVNAGTFAKTYTFNVATGYTADLFGSLSTSYDIFFDTSEFYGANVSSITLSSGTFNSSFTLLDEDVLGDSSWIAYTKNFNFSALNLGAGSYTLTVNGRAYSDNSDYLGSFSVIATPVPEPETYGLMILGLGLVGLAASRRKAV